MSKLVPGRLAKVDDKLLRCKKRDMGCEGCVLNDILLCPRLLKNRRNTPNCIEDGVIFVNPVMLYQV